jgi:hypothetical protein
MIKFSTTLEMYSLVKLGGEITTMRRLPSSVRSYTLVDLYKDLLDYVLLDYNF